MVLVLSGRERGRERPIGQGRERITQKVGSLVLDSLDGVRNGVSAEVREILVP